MLKHLKNLPIAFEAGRNTQHPHDLKVIVEGFKTECKNIVLCLEVHVQFLLLEDYNCYSMTPALVLSKADVTHINISEKSREI